MRYVPPTSVLAAAVAAGRLMLSMVESGDKRGSEAAKAERIRSTTRSKGNMGMIVTLPGNPTPHAK